MRGIQFAIDDFFPNGTPAELCSEADGYAPPGIEPKPIRHQQGRGINQGNIADPECSQQANRPCFGSR
jgi:hypothetical protein